MVLLKKVKEKKRFDEVRLEFINKIRQRQSRQVLTQSQSQTTHRHRQKMVQIVSLLMGSLLGDDEDRLFVVEVGDDDMMFPYTGPRILLY